jgi:hypothetical protein
MDREEQRRVDIARTDLQERRPVHPERCPGQLAPPPPLEGGDQAGERPLGEDADHRSEEGEHHERQHARIAERGPLQRDTERRDGLVRLDDGDDGEDAHRLQQAAQDGERDRHLGRPMEVPEDRPVAAYESLPPVVPFDRARRRRPRGHRSPGARLTKTAV